MDETEKKFNLVDTILLLQLAAFNDVSALAADFALGIPVLGIAIGGMEKAEDLIVWGIIVGVFTFKLGFSGRIGVLQVAGGIGEFVGIPSRTVTVAAGIYMANHPKLAPVAEVASGKIPNIAEGLTTK